MSEQKQTEHPAKLINRWIIVVAAMLVQFALGALYSYSFIKTAVKGFIGSSDETLSLLPFAFALMFFAIFMIPAGRWQDKAGPKPVAITGGIVLVVGILLAGVVAMSPTPDVTANVWGLVATYGMIGGAGIGLVYVCPIACATKWFPDKIGLINGLAVAGFGAGSILFNFVYFFITPFWLTLITAGIMMGVMALLGSFVLKNPPAGFKPAGWQPPAPKAGGVVVENWATKEMVRTKTFYMLWAMYVMSAICGLMVIGNFAPYGKYTGDLVSSELGTFIKSITVYIAIIAGACNASGRIFWGKLSDKIGRVKTMAIMFTVQAGAMILFAIPSIYTWAIFGNLVYFCFGGNLSLFPAATRQFFGAKYMGLNYALVFSAYGVAGILGALLALPVQAAIGFTGYFILFGCMSFAALLVSFLAKAPERKQA